MSSNVYEPLGKSSVSHSKQDNCKTMGNDKSSFHSIDLITEASALASRSPHLKTAHHIYCYYEYSVSASTASHCPFTHCKPLCDGCKNIFRKERSGKEKNICSTNTHKL